MDKRNEKLSHSNWIPYEVTTELSLIQNSLGDSYFEIGDFEKSLSFYFSALKLIEKTGNKTEIDKLKALIAKAMYKKGEKEASNQIVMVMKERTRLIH